MLRNLEPGQQKSCTEPQNCGGMHTTAGIKGAVTDAVSRLNGWRIAAVSLACLLAFATQAPSTVPYLPDLTRQVERLAGQVRDLATRFGSQPA